MAHGIFEVTCFLCFVFKVDNLRIKCVNPLLSEDFNFLLFSPWQLKLKRVYLYSEKAFCLVLRAFCQRIGRVKVGEIALYFITFYSCDSFYFCMVCSKYSEK